MGLERKPEDIQKAIFEDTKESRRFLSAAGRRGASHRVQLEDLRKSLEEEESQKHAAEEAVLFQVTEDGDILPPDKSLPL